MGKFNQYLWSDLIIFFEKNHYIQNGLTIPFLIGTIKLLRGKKITIEQLITELSDPKSHRRTTIMKCGNIGEFVVGIMDFETEKYLHQFPNIIAKEFGNIAITDSSLNNFNSSKEIINFFVSLYKLEIESGNYSKNNGDWTEFTKTDIKRIEHFKKDVINKS